MRTIEGQVRWACIFALVALAMIAWALIQPRPIPVIVAMSVGQVIGTASLLLYVFAIVNDFRKKRVLRSKDSDSPPSTPGS